jgi:hypothetical protein
MSILKVHDRQLNNHLKGHLMSRYNLFKITYFLCINFEFLEVA